MNFSETFKTFFAGGLGFVSAYALVGLFSITFLSIGLYLMTYQLLMKNPARH